MIKRVTHAVWRGVLRGVSALRRRSFILPAGGWVVVAVIALVGGRGLQVAASGAGRRAEIAKAFGSVGLFYGRPQTDQTGERLTFVQQGERGLALFLCDTTTGRRRLVHEEKDTYAKHLRAWPWSPGGDFFVYSAAGKIVVCRADSGETAGMVGIPAEIVIDLVWLTRNSFVYVAEDKNLRLVQQQANGEWKTAFRYASAYDKGKPGFLAAIDTNTVAWLQDDIVWRMSLAETGTNRSGGQAASGATSAAPPLENLVLRLDASTLGQAEGAPVALLADLSPSANDAVVNGTAPTYNAPGGPGALNGKGTLHFSSTPAITNSAGLKTSRTLPVTGAAPRSVFAVVRREAGRQMIISIGLAGKNGAYFGVCDRNDSAYLPTGWVLGDNRIPALPPGWRLLEVVYDGTTAYAYVNGGLKGMKVSDFATAARALELGLRSPGAAGKYAIGSDGDLAELLVYDAALSTSQRQQVEAYLGGKWLGLGNPAESVPQKTAVPWFHPDAGGITSLSYSKDTRQFMLSRAEVGGSVLCCWAPGEGKSQETFRLARAPSLQDVRWVGEKQCAFVSRAKDDGSAVMTTSSSGGAADPLFACRDLTAMLATPDGKRLTVTGAVSNEPSAGIWQYELSSQTLHCVVPYGDHPSPLARRVEAQHGTLALPSRRRLDYYLFRPPDCVRREHKKYPVLIGDTVFVEKEPLYQNRPRGPLWAQAIADCGAFVVIVNRATWWGGIEHWEEDVMGLREHLARSARIDTQRMFLFGASAETSYVNQVVAKHPELWRGVILLNPGALMELPTLARGKPVPRMLISLGELEQGEKRTAQFQADAARCGMPVEYIVHKGEEHWLQSKPAVLERTRAMVRFIFED